MICEYCGTYLFDEALQAKHSEGMCYNTYAARSLRFCYDALEDKLENRKASKREKLAYQRHLNDLEKSKSEDYPFYFDAAAGNYHSSFMEKLPHTKGSWRSSPLILSEWQVFLHTTLFGWKKKKSGFRRFNKLFWMLPRKQGKSLAAAGIGLFMSFCDKEPGAEVYACAQSEKQAMCVFEPAFAMCKIDPELVEGFNLTLSGTNRNPTSIFKISDMSRFEPVVGRASDGQSPHAALVDEFHEASDGALYDSMSTGMGARNQPLLAVITTAGVNLSSPCYEMFLNCVKVLEGTLEQENTFIMIFGIDDDMSYENYDSWRTANPNLGISINEDYLYGKYQDAMNDLSQRSILLTKHLNMWQNTGSAWMDMLKFQACKRPELKLEDFYGKEVWIGIDLANKIDLCAMQLLFKLPDGNFATFGKYYLPEEIVNKKENQHYQLWRDEGLLTSTEGSVTDFFKIEEDLKELSKLFIIKELDFDQKEAHFWVQTIQLWADFECVEIPQSAQFISEPMKTLESLIYEGKMLHDGNKLLTWAFGNVVKKLSRGASVVKYYYPTKQNNANKIDPVCALIMALSRALLCDDNSDSYNSRAANGDTEILRVL